jgi:hypothetical protein
MLRLVVFGCSLTYGHGLPDCFVPPTHPGPVPSKMGWPSLLAKYMNCDYTIKAAPGASNKTIWNNIINFKYKKGDIVIVLWSYTIRTSIIKSNNEHDFIGPWIDDHPYYESMYNKHDSMLMSKLFVSHANMFLANNNITIYNLVTSKSDVGILTIGGVCIPHIPVYMSKIRLFHPTASDSQHPGIQCQEDYAKKILTYLGIVNNLPTYPWYNKIAYKIKQKIKCK